MSFKRWGLSVLTTFTSVSLVATAWAQETGNDDTRDAFRSLLEEVIVTATKFETDLMDTPLAVSSFNEEYLDTLGINNVKELVNVVPNMSIMVDVESNAPIITMRGVRSTNTTELGDPAVGVHYDGIYSPRPQGALALMFDVERVEALRGPQGTLYGRNSTVGTLNIISAKPQFDEFTGKVDLEVGRWNQRSIKGVLNFPVSETFAVRAAVYAEKRDSNLTGYYDPNQWDLRYLDEMGIPFVESDSAVNPAANTVDYQFYFEDTLYEEVLADPSDFYNMIDQNAFRISAYWKPNNDLAWLLTYEVFNDDSAGGINAHDCERIANRPVSVWGGTCQDIWGTNDDFVAYVNIPGKNDMTLESFRSHLTYAINDNVEFMYNMGFQSQERVGQIDLDQGAYLWDQMLKWVDTDYDSWSHELQFKSTNPESRLQWVAGYFNFEEDNYMNGQYQGAMGGVSLWLQPERVLKSDALFAQGTYELNERTFLTLGLRHTRDSKEDIGGNNWGCWSGECHPQTWAWVPWHLINWGAFGDLSQQSPEYLAQLGSLRAGLNALPSDYFDYPNDDFNIDTVNDTYAEWDKTTWRIGLDYDLNDDTMIYGYVANGYKGGGIGDVVFRQSDGTRFDTSYEEENVITYEFGVKTRALDGKLNLRGNFFISDYQDQQFTAWTIFDTYEVEVVDPDTGLPTVEQEELGTFLTRNAADSKIMGLELEAEWNAWENGFIGGYFTWLDTELESDFWKRWGQEPGGVFKGYDPAIGFDQDFGYVPCAEPPCLPWFGNLKGNDLAYSPEFAFTVNISHTWDLDSGATLVPFVNIHWEDESYVDIDNNEKWDIDPSALVDGIDLEAYSDKRDAWWMATASLKYTSAEGQWWAEGYVYNLTDENVNWWQGWAGSTPVAAKAPRSYGVKFGYNW